MCREKPPQNDRVNLFTRETLLALDCGFVHDRGDILQVCQHGAKEEARARATFFLYRVVTLVAKTPFLILLVAR